VGRPVLGLIGHGTDGSDGLERGIHLRWAFRREVGFPPGGFCLHRRPAQIPPMKCVDFGHVRAGVHGRVVLPHSEFDVRLESAQPIRAERVSVARPDRALDVLRKLGLHAPRHNQETVLRAPEPIRIAIPPTSMVLVEVIAPRGKRARASAYALDRKVDNASGQSGIGGAIGLLLRADLIDAVEVAGPNLRLVRICFARPEPCDDMEGWQQIGICPMCLPISHRGYGCKHRRPGCDEEEARDRLPKDPCVRGKYDGANLDDLLDVIRAAVDPTRGPTMGSRLPDLPASADDCPPPGTEVPELGVSALDALLITSVDPVVARVLGLYHVDTTAIEGQKYDYKIVGIWPEGTLWTLENSIGFDEREPGEIVPPAWSHENVAFVFNRWSRVITVPTNFAGTRQAVALQPETFDWSSFFPGSAVDTPHVAIRFAEPVGEVQLYARHSGEVLKMRAFRNGDEVATAESASPDAILATHADGGIDTVFVYGDLRMLFKIDYEKDYISHGRHCHITFGRVAGSPAALAAPGNVKGVALRGVTRKQNDCQPLGEGAIADTRHLVGVRWAVPAAPDGTLLAKDPVRFRVERENPDATSVLVGGDDPVTVVPPDPDSEGRPPLDWPTERQHVVDIVPYPGRYRYHVEGIDIFGRQSGFGPWSEKVNVQAVAPPPPSAVSAKWLDPADRFLTDDEREWIDGNDKAGLLLRWAWLDSQERQSPFAEEFHVLIERGWLNLLTGTAETDPVATGADAFTVDVKFGRELNANVLAGMTMSRGGVPYHIRSSTATAMVEPFVSTLVCTLPNSGMPRWRTGTDLAVPLLPSVRAVVEQVTPAPGGRRAMRLLIGDLRAVPPAGFVGGAVLAGEERWAILASAGAVDAGDGVRVTVEIDRGKGKSLPWFMFALTNQRVTVELPPLSPPYTDFRNPANWDMSVGPVPSEGPGDYEVFIRQTELGEAVGRTLVEPRRHRILTDAALLDATRTAYGQAALATATAGTLGAASSPASFVRVDRTKPNEPAAIPVPGADAPGDIAPLQASLPAPYEGNASYAHRWQHAEGLGYVVYRALDEALFAIDRRVRGTRSKVRANWNAFLDQFPDPEGTLRDQAFDLFVTQANPPDYASLNPKNRLLHILASFPDVLVDAFTRLNSELIAWDDAKYADRPTETAGPGEGAYAPQANRRLYIDRSLPRLGKNAYFYRVGGVDSLGNVGPVSVSTPPIWLRDLEVPRTPILAPVTNGDRWIELRWTAVPEATRFLVYRGRTRDDTRDLSLLGPAIVELPAVPPVVTGGEVDLGSDTGGVTAEHVYRLADLEAADDPLAGAPGSDLLAAPAPIAGGRVGGVGAPDGTPVVVVFTDAAARVQYTVLPGGHLRWVDGNRPGAVDTWYVAVAARDTQVGGEVRRLRSEPSAPAVGRAYDLSVPAVPEWQRSEWVKVGEDGVEHPYDDPVASAISAIRLAWSGPEANDEVLIERLRPGQVVWAAITGWQPGALTSRDEEVDETVSYRYRLRVRRTNGNSTLGPITEIAGH